MFKLFEIPFPWSDPLDFFFLCETTHDTCMNVYERARVCVCARQKENERVLKGRPLQTEEAQTYKCVVRT